MSVSTHKRHRPGRVVQVEGDGQLQGVKSAEVLGRTDAADERNSGLVMSDGQPDDMKPPGSHVIPQPPGEAVEVRLDELSGANLLRKDGVKLDNAEPRDGVRRG